MTNKLGFHVASASRKGASDLLKAGAALVTMVDQNMIAEAKAAGAITTFRTKRVPGEDNPLGIDRESLANMPGRAFDWLKALFPIWAANAGAHFYHLNNEWDIGDLDAGRKINAFTLEAMRIADGAGYKLAVFNFSMGCPSDNLANGQPCSMEDRLETILPALSYAAAHDHAVSLHVHTDRGDLPGTGEALALRFQRLLRYCKAHGFLPKVVITELSNGTGGIQPNMTRYLTAINWWNMAVQASEFAPQVLGGALYGFNAAETIAPAVPSLVKLMQIMAPPPDPIVTYRGTCPASVYDRVSAQVMAAGGTIEKVA